MLEDLDTIPWADLTHAYGSAADVPDLIRAMVRETEGSAFLNAWGEFVNAVHHQGSIYPATPYTVPFLLELIKAPQTPPLPRACYLNDLASFVEGAHVHHESPSRKPWSRIVDFRLNLQLYDAVSAGLETYLAQLSGADVAVRAVAVYLLGMLPDQHARILPALVEAHPREADEWVRSGVIWSCARLVAGGLPGILESDRRRVHDQRLLEWVQAPVSRPERIAAAAGYLHTLLFPPYDVPPAVPQLLASAFSDPVSTPKAHEEVPFTTFEEFVPFDQLPQEITRFCRRAYRPDLWIAVLKQANLPPLRAHPLIRELLSVEFERYRFDEPWMDLEWFQEERPPDQIIYQIPDPSRYYVPGKPLNPFQKQALAFLVSYDPFWEIPTNLLEFFYDLPNARDELRRLIE